MFKLFLYVILSINISFASSGNLNIPGTGDSELLLKLLGQKFMKLNPGTNVIIPSSIGSSGGIKKIIHGHNNLARTARGLKKSEKDKGISEFIFAYSPIVFVVNNENINKNFTSQEILDIFSGKIRKFEDIKNSNVKGKIFQIIREHGDSSLRIIEKNFPKFKEIENYTGKIYYSTAEAKKHLLQYKNTIGYIPLPEIKNTNLKILTIDNITINKKNILNAKYKLLTPFALVYKGKLEVLEKKFLAFLKSKEAKEIMKKHRVIPN